MMSDIWIRRKVDVVNADVLNQSIKKVLAEIMMLLLTIFILFFEYQEKISTYSV